VQAAAAGFHDQLRLALSDGITRPRLTALLAQCREEEPQVDIRLFEVPLGQQLRGLHEDLYDLGFAQSPEVGDGIVAMPAWSDPLVVAVPARHPLLAYQRIPLDEVLRHPLVACDPQSCEGHCHQIRRILRGADREPLVVEQVSSHDLMLTLVAAGYALSLVGASHLAASRREEVVARPLAGRSQVLTTWLLRRDAEPSETLRRFIGRVTPISGDPTHEGDSFTSDTKGEN
jgi:DNA-binding transcriptional LysR family regulator